MQHRTGGVTDTFNDTIAATPMLASSMSAYTQLISFGFLRASVSAQISMIPYQMTLLVFHLELTMMNKRVLFGASGSDMYMYATTTSAGVDPGEELGGLQPPVLSPEPGK